MLSKISLFLKSLAVEQPDEDNELSLELACAVLLCEVIRADGEYTQEEKNTLNTIMQTKFHLSKNEAVEVLNTATSLSENSTDFYQFTNNINQHYNLEQRKEMVSLLWEIAYADGNLASIEEHIIRRISDLLHLNHGEYIQVKINSTP